MIQYVYVNGYLDVARNGTPPYEGTTGLVLEFPKVTLSYKSYILHSVVTSLLAQMLSVHQTITSMVVSTPLLISVAQRLTPKYYAMPP